MSTFGRVVGTYIIIENEVTCLKLRNFLYLNTKVVEDYIAAIDGYTYDEESQAIATSKENVLSGKGAIGVASGNGSHTGKQSEYAGREQTA